jgi:hypothetical protein
MATTPAPGLSPSAGMACRAALLSLLVACVGAASTLGPGQHRVCIFDFDGALLSRPPPSPMSTTAR